jgi:hypothetical protein
LLTPDEVVDLGDEDQKRNGIPIFLTDEIGIEFACPFVCYVLPLSVFGTNCVVNVMRRGTAGNPRTILSTRSSMYGKELRERPWYRPSTRDLSALRLRDQTLPTRSLRGKPFSFVKRMQSSPFRNLSGTVSNSWYTVADASNGGV